MGRVGGGGGVERWELHIRASFSVSYNCVCCLLCCDRNAVPFTSTQVEAIRAGMQPGLTMVG